MPSPVIRRDLSPQVKRALCIMLRDRTVNRIGNQWWGDSRAPIHDHTMFAMFDRNLAFISSAGRRSKIAHRAFLTGIGKTIAASLEDENSKTISEPISECASLFVAEVIG